MAKYVTKAANLRKHSQENKELSPYAQNPHTPDYSGVSKISTTPEPLGKSGSSISTIDHPLSPNSNQSSTSNLNNTKPQGPVPALPLPRPHRNNPKMSQNFPKSPSKPSTNVVSPSNEYKTDNSQASHASHSTSRISHPLQNTTQPQQPPQSSKQLNLPQLPKNSRNQSSSIYNSKNPWSRPNNNNNNNNNNSNDNNNNTNNNNNSTKNQESKQQGRSIFDLSLNANRTKVVSLSAFSYLFCELINYSQKGISNIAELEDKLSEIGYYIGARQLELIIYRNKPGKREIDRIGILEFIQKTVWKRLFQKQADGLEQSMANKNEFFIIDNAPITNKFVSVPSEMGEFNCASFIGGIIHGILDNAGFPCKVITHEAPMENNDTNASGSNEFNASGAVTYTKLEQMRTVFIVQFQ